MKQANIYAGALSDFIEREDQYVDFKYSIGGIPVYGVIRRYVRELFCQSVGVGKTNDPIRDKKKYLLNIIRSLFQLLAVLLKKKKYRYFIYSFYRTERVGDKYIDKFTDPLIENSNIKKDFIIFEHHRDGYHRNPRIHSEKVVYTDIIEVIGVVLCKIRIRALLRKYKEDFVYLWKMLDSLMGDVEYDKEKIQFLFFRVMVRVRIYEFIFRRLGVKKMIAPARPVFLDLLYAAKKNNIKVYEVQHGILSAPGISYSGIIDESYTPDFFLSYGKIDSPELYGIPADRCINIGWALPNYMNSINPIICVDKQKDVLVVLNPFTSRETIEIILHLAETNISSNFYIRPHPTEAIPMDLMDKIEEKKNVIIQDNLIVFSYILSLFTMVMGDNSSALNEAFSECKKVGRLSYPGFSPLYLNKEEEMKTWKIYDDLSFKAYLDAEPFGEIKTNVYSPYNRELVDELFD